MRAPAGVLRAYRVWSVTRERLDDLIDADQVTLDILEVEATGHDDIVGDFEQSHTAHLERLPVGASAGPVPLAPGDLPIVDRAHQLGAEIGYPGEHGRPVGAHLPAAGERSAGVGRL